MDVQIILPPVSDEPLSDMLRAITEAIVKKDDEKWVGGFQGGEFGYGAAWSGPVFDMRPFFWGDCDCGYDELELAWCDAHTHSEQCYQSELKRESVKAGATIHPRWGWTEWPETIPYDKRRLIEERIYNELCRKHGLSRYGCAVHCTCEYDVEWKAWSAVNGHKPTCTPELPNFLHHASGLKVSWYKYIGRGMEVENLPADLTPVFTDCLADIAAQVDGRPEGRDGEAGSGLPTSAVA